MTPTAVGPDGLYLEQIEQARAQSFEQKFLAGGDLFELSCELMAAGVRIQFPDAEEPRVRHLVAQRLALGRRLENGM